MQRRRRETNAETKLRREGVRRLQRDADEEKLEHRHSRCCTRCGAARRRGATRARVFEVAPNKKACKIRRSIVVQCRHQPGGWGTLGVGTLTLESGSRLPTYCHLLEPTVTVTVTILGHDHRSGRRALLKPAAPRQVSNRDWPWRCRRQAPGFARGAGARPWPRRRGSFSPRPGRHS